jgi:threonine/homoserine/homoserine lactone efflux protein
MTIRQRHIVLAVLGVAALLLGELAKTPHFAWAGGALLLVTDLRRVLAGAGADAQVEASERPTPPSPQAVEPPPSDPPTK